MGLLEGVGVASPKAKSCHLTYKVTDGSGTLIHVPRLVSIEVKRLDVSSQFLSVGEVIEIEEPISNTSKGEGIIKWYINVDTKAVAVNAERLDPGEYKMHLKIVLPWQEDESTTEVDFRSYAANFELK